jgi:gamma-glutamyl-gamma-aminobutyrate hydrolase PuuD
MPVIGITACRKLEDYRQAVLHVGGEVRVVDASMPVEQALAGIDGLLLTGGGDVAPALYGESPHPTVVGDEAGRAGARWCRTSRRR